MKGRLFSLIFLSVILVATLSFSVDGSMCNIFYSQASPISSETPKVILQQGTAGTSTIYVNNTSAKVSVAATGWNVQSGTGFIPAGNNNTSVQITPINLSRSFLLVEFAGGKAGVQPEQDVIVSGKFNSPSQLRFDRVGTTSPAYFSWYVIQASSTQISVQSGTTIFGSTDTQKNVTINNVSNATNCVIFLSRASTGTNETQYSKAFVTGQLTSTSNLWLQRQGTGTTVTVQWFVVKFNDGTIIQTGETAVSTSNPTNQKIASVDLSRTWLYFTWRATANGLAQVSVRGWLQNSTDIQFFRQTTTGTCYVRWFVIQMPQGTNVQSGYYNSQVTTDSIVNIPIASVDLSRSFSFTTSDSSGTGTYFPRPFWIETITNSTNLQLQRKYTGQTSDHNWQVIQLPIGYTPVLDVKNQVANTWNLRLNAYSESNIARLSNCTIYFYYGSGVSRQTYILNGTYSQRYGTWYNLTSAGIVYIAVAVSATSTGTSCVYANLEVLVPGTSIDNLLIISFAIS